MRRSIVLGTVGLFGTLVVCACGPNNEENPPPKPPPVASVSATTPPPPPIDTTPPPTPPPAKPPMAQMQKTAMDTAQNALNAHDAKAFASVFADNAVVAVAGLNELQGKDAVEQNMKEWFETFSKIKLGFNRFLHFHPSL